MVQHQNAMHALAIQWPDRWTALHMREGCGCSELQGVPATAAEVPVRMGDIRTTFRGRGHTCSALYSVMALILFSCADGYINVGRHTSMYLHSMCGLMSGSSQGRSLF